VDEAVQDHEAGERRARYLAKGGMDGAIERARAVHGVGEPGQGRPEAGQDVRRVGLAGFNAAERRCEHGRPADHVLENAANRELGTRGRLVELVGRDPADDAYEQRAEQVQLVEYFHGSSLGLGSSVVDRAGLGNGELGGLPVAAQLDELGHVTRGCARLL
jgi:hypothetical protein